MCLYIWGQISKMFDPGKDQNFFLNVWYVKTLEFTEGGLFSWLYEMYEVYLSTSEDTCK